MRKIVVVDKGKKLIFLVTEDWYFCSHRLPLAIAAKASGYDVIVATRVAEHGAVIEKAGLRLIQLHQLKRSSLNPFKELLALFEIIAIYNHEMPDLVHHVAIKPTIYGSLAARLTGVTGVVNALGGLGFVFTSKKFMARLLRPLLSKLFSYLLNNPCGRLILQNGYDMDLLASQGLVDATYIRLIRGAGVNLEEFSVQPLSDGIPLVILASRMLWDKGVGEFVALAETLKTQGVCARFAIVGDTDTESPTAISYKQLSLWQEEGYVEWWGHQCDMPSVFAQAYLVCLPTYYGEGVPKVLLEAMACGRAIITTDIPGCRELVVNGSNGLLIPPHNIKEFAASVVTLLQDRPMCKSMGKAGRKIVESEYAIEHIVEATLDVYEELCAL